MEIKMVKLADIVPYENNPRNNADAVEPVKESIKQFGFKNPMILDKENVIVAGHTRYEAAQALGMTEVPVIYADDLTEEEVKKFRLVDNKTSEFAGWDFSKLEEELADLNFEDFDFGFGSNEQEDLSDYFTVAPAKPVTQTSGTGSENQPASNPNYFENTPDIDYGTPTQQAETSRRIKCPHCGKWIDL